MPKSLSIFQGSTEHFTEFKYSNLFKSYQYLHHNHLNRRKREKFRNLDPPTSLPSAVCVQPFASMVGLGASLPPVTTDSVAVDLGLFVPLVVLGFDLFAGISGLSSLSLELVLDLDLLLKLDPSNSLSLIVDGCSTTLLSNISPSKSVESKSCACLLANNWRLGRVELGHDSCQSHEWRKKHWFSYRRYIVYWHSCGSLYRRYIVNWHSCGSLYRRYIVDWHTMS